ncbi:MAG: efflux transporter outer membrane subunit [Rhodopila sp.]|nr:efflux transporter outer membrane subunit [Rhodopila sp.]
MRPFISLLIATTLLGACSLDPDYRRPDAPVADRFPDGPAYPQANAAAPAVPADAIGWRDFFRDPQLQALIEIALRNNRDLRVSVLNVAAAQAQYRIQRADLFPTVALTGSENTVGFPKNGSGGSAPALAGKTATVFTAGLGVTSFELDLFGKAASESRSAFEQYLGLEETRRSAQISLVAQVATAYLTLLGDRQLLKLTQDTLTSQTQSYNLTKMTLNVGTATALTLRQAETTVATAQANLAQYTRQVAQDENALALLIGQPLPADLPPGRDLDGQILAALPAGLPSDVLTRRPDIMAAEHNLLAANASIGAARAAFFPSISLTASAGKSSTRLSTLFTGPANAWSFAPQVVVPIFTGGANVANLDLAKVQKNTQIAEYEKAIQTAFREVADALAAQGTYGDQLRAQRTLVDANADSYRLAMMRFRTGVDSFLTTLDSERSLYASQQSLIVAQLANRISEVTMYKVLGGGWNEHTPAAP